LRCRAALVDEQHSAWVHYDDGVRPELLTADSLRSAATQSQVYGLLYERTADGQGQQQQAQHPEAKGEAKGESKQRVVAMDTSKEEGDEIAGGTRASNSGAPSAGAGSGSGNGIIAPQGAAGAAAGTRPAAARKR